MSLNDREKLLVNFLKDNKVEMRELIDLTIKVNGFVGVGLVTFEEYLVDSVRKHHKEESLDKIMNG
tara:strand:- start:1038 stop:1235 length:198 start_codon:yes stop_codon:yes gene_type:complete